MKKSILLLYIYSMCLVIVFFTIAMFIDDNNNKNIKQANLNSITGSIESFPPENVVSAEVSTNFSTPLITDAKDILITESTEIVYEKHYTLDGITESTLESAPYFLIGKDDKYISALFSDWVVSSFSSDKIVLKKTVNAMSNQHYIIGNYNGFVAVFYDTSDTPLKLITEKPVNALSAGEVEKLRIGVKIIGLDNLYKALEDYGS